MTKTLKLAPREWLMMLGALILLFTITSRPTVEAPGVSIPEAMAMVEEGALLIDVRGSPKTHLPGALLIPIETLAAQMARRGVEKTQPIVVYCGNGSTLGPRAVHALREAGYVNAVNLTPGFEGWRAANLPVVSS